MSLRCWFGSCALLAVVAGEVSAEPLLVISIDGLHPSHVIDAERHAAISQKMAIQERDAVWWRDACLLYFQTFAKRPLPNGVESPAKSLDHYKAKALEW